MKRPASPVTRSIRPAGQLMWHSPMRPRPLTRSKTLFFRSRHPARLTPLTPWRGVAGVPRNGTYQ